VTTPNASDFFVVDSSGWVEYFADGPKASIFARYFEEREEELFLPSIIVFEVYKKFVRENANTAAELFLSKAFAFRDRLIPLDLQLAALAAKTSLDAKLPMADAVIYASARARRAQLITSDAHFSGLPGVTLV
jgi:predicted nucleic acid-binding protein